ncbi:hypothetical protein DICPUDRAFT_74383 [Dictyostelium purpureum]|uniref:PNPLA domain-containing protein n=1 Tax=Dictyostelium purpureum TaxID=5786 RepID=F0Z7K5_DICPU|nr:uncharacterized protein DICPUDRAFT_74383 [Dictyostelium purpureum]EGC40034.1 hypothetical protein DICPUDRAFT_74383 [Dictyostelium purpureum]|eukprot:XP_003283383.1 hypothetical protein DICPUDRAFT_74383 [Dictyostelium purpureum]
METGIKGNKFIKDDIENTPNSFSLKEYVFTHVKKCDYHSITFTKYCVKDGAGVCIRCDHHKHCLKNKNNIIEYREYLDTVFFVKYGLLTESYKNINDYNLAMDIGNKFLMIDYAERVLSYGPKWSNIGLSDGDPFLSVGFVGYSGGGKSTVIASLCEDDSLGKYNHPIPAVFSSSDSTSSDLNSFIGGTLGTSEKLKYIIFDSEGMGGTLVPAMLQKLEKKMDSYINDFKQYRSSIVQIALPRLLYIVSDVLVFTFKGDPKEKSKVGKKILKFAEVSTGIPNNTLRPHLIILLNRQTTTKEYDDVEFATKDFFKGAETSLYDSLKICYESITVIYLPNIHELEFDSFFRYQRQIILLKSIISCKVNESYAHKKNIGFSLNKKNNMERISNIIGFLNNSPKDAPDLSLLNSSCIKRSSFEDEVDDLVVRETRRASLKIEEKKDEQTTIFKIAKKPFIGNSTISAIGNNRQRFNSAIGVQNNSTVKENQKIYRNNTESDLLKMNSSKEIKYINEKIIIVDKKEQNISTDRKRKISNNLFSYFKRCYNVLNKSGKTRRECYQISVEQLKSKVFLTYFLFLQRNNISQEDNLTIYEEFLWILNTVSDNVSNYIPCKEMIDGKYHCINLKGMHNFHISKETEQKKIGFLKKVGTNGVIDSPFKMEGSYTPMLQYESLADYLKKMLLNPENISKGFEDLEIKNSSEFCVKCLLDSPIIPFDCDHMLCVSCSEANGFNCPCDGCIGKIQYKKEIDFTPSMGSRILTLDGGGIRGIVECCILQRIQEELYDIEITKLFDLIIGTSTGGIISLGLGATDKSPKTLIDTFEKMATDVFSSSIARKFVSLFKLTTKYSRSSLHECLKAEIGNVKLTNTFKKTRIGVTSVTEESGGPTDCFYINYPRKVNSESLSKYINYSSCIDGAEATSAAPTYFPPFVFENRKFYDGGIKNNNPCLVAMDEHTSLWGNKTIDVFVSLGTGEFSYKRSKNDNILELANLFVNLLSEVELSWKKLHEKKNISEGENSFRINVPFTDLKSEIGLDDKRQDSIKILKSSSEKILGNKNLSLAINKILSSLFYLNNLQWCNESQTLEGIIMCRLNSLPKELVNQINDSKPFFILDPKNNKLVDFEMEINVKHDSPCNIPFRIINPPNQIDIVCALVSKSKFKNNSSISGCPFILNRDYKFYNIYIKKNIQA